jgi:hypothetical protein
MGGGTAYPSKKRPAKRKGAKKKYAKAGRALGIKRAKKGKKRK